MIGYDWINKQERDDGKRPEWYFSAEMIDVGRPVFDDCISGPGNRQVNNHKVAKKLREAGILTDSCEVDGEQGCLWVYFKQKRHAYWFIDRLNKYIEKHTPLRQVGPPHRVGSYLLRVIDNNPTVWVEAKWVGKEAGVRPGPCDPRRITFGPEGLQIHIPEEDLFSSVGDQQEIPHEVLAAILKACGWKVEIPD